MDTVVRIRTFLPLRLARALIHTIMWFGILHHSSFYRNPLPSSGTQQANRAHDKRNLYKTCIVSQLSQKLIKPV